jgi:Helix-turn-helix domain
MALPEPLLRGPAAERIVLSTELDPWLPLRALAGYSGLSVRTLRDYINAPMRALPCYRIGGKVLVRRGEFDAWMLQHRQVGPGGLDRAVDSVIGPSTRRR